MVMINIHLFLFTLMAYTLYFLKEQTRRHTSRTKADPGREVNIGGPSMSRNQGNHHWSVVFLSYFTTE
jgi:hypothetical protein